MAKAIAILGKAPGKEIIMEIVGPDGQKIGEHKPSAKEEKFKPPYELIYECGTKC